MAEPLESGDEPDVIDGHLAVENERVASSSRSAATMAGNRLV